MTLNKVDLAVKRILLAYPSMYRNRFDVMAEIMFNSGYRWDENGCIIESVPICTKGEPTVDSMQKEMVERLIKQCKHAQEHSSDCLKDLNDSLITEAKFNLAAAEFIGNNIDVYAKTYCGVDYSVKWLWLLKTDHQGINQDYGCINHKPDVVDEEWRVAIYHWLRELLPMVNSLFGMCEEKGWTPKEKHKDIFNWAYSKFMLYQSEQERSHMQGLQKMYSEILAKADAVDQLDDDITEPRNDEDLLD